MHSGNGFNSDSDILKKVDMIRERVDVSYRQAKDALDRNQGDLLNALIDLEGGDKSANTDKAKWSEEFSVRSNEVVDKVKELIRQGNINKIRIKHEGKVLADIPVSLGAIGAVVLPQLAALSVLVAVFNRCTIEVIRTENDDEDGEIVLKSDENEENKIKIDAF